MTEGTKITLILEGNRFQVDKKRIMEKSKYFESLFSHNFSDSKDNEQIVNYKVEPMVLQDFCDWIEEDSPSSDESHQIKISLQKFLSDNFDCLKQLLELSIIYSVDELSLELSDLMVSHWLKPELLLDIWKLSKDLSLDLLRDATYAACLDRFMDLPEEELLSISGSDFLKLVCNVNVKSSTDYLSFIAKERLKNQDFSSENSDLQLKLGIYKLLELLDSPERKPSTMYCIFAEAMIENTEESTLKRQVYGVLKHVPVEFCELVEIWRMDESGKDLVGMSVIGQGFSIYKIGGELRLGSCKFNMNIWRYCLISKKWYYLARLRKARRHMAVALVDETLILFGGVGRYRLKLSSVEMLNLHTGSWTTAPDIPETFTDVPPTCVINGIVVLCVSSIYMFNPTTVSWIQVKHEFDANEFCGVKCLTAYKNILFIGKEGGKFIGYNVTWETSQGEDGKTVVVGAQITLSAGKVFQTICEKILIDEHGQAIGMAQYSFENYVMIEHGRINEATGQLNSEQTCLKKPHAAVTPISYLNLIHPNTLYKQILLE
ncbi:uncharacterized protein LOC106636133 [Copidosoma floridanum]|uniref:uncharacterized protein LOC106636133 n=1 Tax=Copidosoma floridanum TaxID=29053 RepID=UPI0006C96FE0|nr:uncharacterized protein LOC106636133 [Copidosoma floridanum]